MIKKIITLFKLGRKIASSDILEIVSKFQKPPLAITLLFKFLSISFSPKKKVLIMNIKKTIKEIENKSRLKVKGIRKINVN